MHNFWNFYYVFSPSENCIYHLLEHYNIHEQTTEEVKVRQITFELCEFLTDVLKVDDFGVDFSGKVRLYQSCDGLRDLKLDVSGELIIERNSNVHRRLQNVRGIELINLDREDEFCVLLCSYPAHPKLPILNKA